VSLTVRLPFSSRLVPLLTSVYPSTPARYKAAKRSACISRITARAHPPLRRSQDQTCGKHAISKPARLVEVEEAMHGIHPEDRTKVESKEERARRLGRA